MHKNILLASQELNVLEMPAPALAFRSKQSQPDQDPVIYLDSTESITVYITPDQVFKHYLPKDSRFEMLGLIYQVERDGKIIKSDTISNHQARYNINIGSLSLKKGDILSFRALKTIRINYKNERIIYPIELST